MRFNKLEVRFNHTAQELTKHLGAQPDLAACDRAAAAVHPTRPQRLPVAYSSKQGIATYAAVTAYRNTLR